MTAITLHRRTKTNGTQPEIWRCDGCQCFHLLAGETLLTFTPDEFEKFARDVTECYCVAFKANDHE